MLVPYVDIGVVGLNIGLATAGATSGGSAPMIAGGALGTFLFAVSAFSGRAKVMRCRQTGPGSVPGQRVVIATGLTRFAMDKVLAVRPDQTTSAEAEKWFGPPTSRTDIAASGPCVSLWLWVSGTEALAISFRRDGTVCELSTAGGPPLP
jgi:hypothetical protein